MPDIRYVCLSDLHFGAENSILTSLVDGGVAVDPGRVSPVLRSLVAGLAQLVAANEQRERKPTLILCGDILELALATDNVALMVFEQFVDLAFPAGSDPVFDETILYLPGNHDHHLWETARERQYTSLLADLPAGEELPVPWHSTRLYHVGDPRPVQAELLEALIRRRSHRSAVGVRTIYPNLGLRSPDGARAVVFHHGHFVESLYRLMSTLKDLILPGRAPAEDVWDWEAENFAWIDFFWSTLGRSGDVGADVGLIYDMLQSDPAIRRLAGNIADGMAQRSHLRAPARFGEQQLLRFGLQRLAGRVAATERRVPTVALTEKSEAGLVGYLAGPVSRQLRREAPQDDDRLPDDVSFVFGHTHKPFVTSRRIPGYAKPVVIHNTGGWVVDTLVPEPLHGASVVLLDEALDVVSLRLYNQSADPTSYRVRLDRSAAVEPSPLHVRLEGLLDPNDEPWRELSQAAATAVQERNRALGVLVANGGQPTAR